MTQWLKIGSQYTVYISTRTTLNKHRNLLMQIITSSKQTDLWVRWTCRPPGSHALSDRCRTGSERPWYFRLTGWCWRVYRVHRRRRAMATVEDVRRISNILHTLHRHHHHKWLKWTETCRNRVPGPQKAFLGQKFT